MRYLKYKKVKTQLNRFCGNCEKYIHAGNVMYYSVAVDGRDFYYGYFCANCASKFTQEVNHNKASEGEVIL